MAPIQVGTLLPYPQPATPPGSPDLSSPEHIKLNNVQLLIEMVDDIVAKNIASIRAPQCSLHLPLDNPATQPWPQPITIQDTKDMVAQTSEPEYKKVDEVWNAQAYKYMIMESRQMPDEADELNPYVFVVRARVDKKTTETTFFIDVKSQWLRDVLRTILKDAHAIHVEQNLLYHYLPELELSQSWHSTDPLDHQGAKHVGVLVNYLRETYAETSQNLKSLLQNGEITYDLLWALFKPNDSVFTTCHGTHKPRCVKYDFGEEKTTNSGSKNWNIECRYQDYDGTEFGEVSIELSITRFRGAKRIDLLEAFPLHYHPDYDCVRTDLIQNGQKFVSLIGSHHRQFKGPAFRMDNGHPVEMSVDGRIMIDAELFQKINPDYSRRKITEPAESIPVSDFWDMFQVVGDDEQGGSGACSQVTNPNIETDGMAEEDFLICCPTVLGFSFADKQWVEFAVADIKEIQWSCDPFNCLVIPDDDREVIMALAEARNCRIGQEPTFEFDDVVAGKGRGLNILLHGNPGLGKTLTAEAASEHLKRPLYSISAGELSTNAAGLEAQLCQIFQIAKHWGAVLLLDEADVYLERRSNHELVRNSLVSVFLRKLEYCEGIMFLTTNRVSQFDEAILSRIHLTLRYDDLDKMTKEQIWRQFLDRAKTRQGPAEVRNSELKGLVASKFNGRQIKNIVATAHAMATKQQSCVQFRHLQKAVAINERFVREFYGKNYVESVYN